MIYIFISNFAIMPTLLWEIVEVKIKERRIIIKKVFWGAADMVVDAADV